MVMPNPYVFPLECDCQIDALDTIYYERFGELRDGSFVEVGAFDGYQWSNTWPLTQLGWKGLLIEPNPEYYALCYRRYNGNQIVTCRQCAVGDHNGTAKLYLGGSLSTICEETVDVYNDMGWSRIAGLSLDRSVNVPLYTLDSVLGTWSHGPWGIDLLVIDVEGAELRVLNGFSIGKYLPRMMIIETHEKYDDKRLSYKARAVLKKLRPFGYEKIYADSINSIYWRENG